MTKHEFRRALEHFGWTQDFAAIALGVSVRSVHAYANGRRIPLATQKLLRLIISLGIAPDDPALDKPIGPRG